MKHWQAMTTHDYTLTVASWRLYSPIKMLTGVCLTAVRVDPLMVPQVLCLGVPALKAPLFLLQPIFACP